MNNINPKEVINIEAVYSRFRMRMRVATISLLMVFFSQQVSWACAGNLSLLVNLPPSPLIYQDHGEFNRLVAKRVYSLVKPSFRDKAQELKSAYQWLKQPSTQTVPCSTYVLYNLLQAKGIKPKIEDISASLISLDLKAGNLKPPFTASRIDNSLYALAKTAESQGILLYPFRLNAITPELLNSLNSQTPFIAHLNYSEALDKGHFVLVTGIEADKVHFFYDKGNTFLPLDKFLEEFSGYCLVSAVAVGAEHCSVPTISDAEAKSVLGAKSYKGVKVDYTKLFKEPSTTDLLIGFGVSMGTMFGGSMLSGMRNGQGLSFGKAFAGLGAGIAQAEISKASVNFSVQQFKMKPLYAQIIGFGVSGAMSGAMGGIGNDTNFKFKGDNFFSNFMNKHSIFRGATMGFVQGGMQGTGSVLAYQGIKNTSFYKDNPFIARQAAALVGSAVGYMGFYAMTGAMKMNVNIDKNNNKVFGVDQEGTQVTYSDGSMHNRISSDGMTGGAGVFNNVKLALSDSSFLSSMISQGTALGVEWAAGPKYAKYSRILGQGIGSAAGGLATGNGISPWKMMMNGALSGGISLGLGYLGGEVGPDGKNKLGLTDIQMAGIEWLGTATLYSGIGAAMSKTPGTTFADAFGQRFSEFSTDYVSFGRTSPLYTKGAGGWSSFMYNQKIADFGGYANYKANADYSMKLQGYKSWSKFVDDGKAANLLPSFSNSLVRYASTSLHYGAVSNAVATVGWLPKSVTNFLGIAKHEIINKKDSDILHEILIKQSGMDESRVITIDAEVKKNNELNGISLDSKNSWIGISEVDSNVVVGRSFFNLGGSEVVYDKGEFVSLNHHLRRALEIDGTQVGNSLYHLGDKYNASDLQSLDGGSGGLLISTKRPGEAYTVNLFNLLAYAQNSGYVSGRVSESTRDGTGKRYVGAVSNKHEKGKPTITDIFTAQQVTPKKFWFDKKTPINTGITLAVYNRPINTAQGPIYLGKDNNGLYPAAGFGYSQSGIVTKPGDEVLSSKDAMIVRLSVLGQGVKTETTEDIMSVVEPEKTVKDETSVVAPVSTEQKVEGEAKDVEKTKFTGADIMKRFRLDQKDGGVVFYFGDMKAGDIPGLTFQFNKDKGNYDAILNNEKIAEVDGVEDMIAPGKYRFRWHGNPTTYRDESWDTESKAEKTGNKAVILKKEEISKAAEASLASKDETPVSKDATSGQTGLVKVGEKTTTITPKIFTDITIKGDLSNGNGLQFEAAEKSAYVAVKSQEVVVPPAKTATDNKGDRQARAEVKKMNIVAYDLKGKPLTEDDLIQIYAEKEYYSEGINNGYVNQNKYVNESGDVIALSAGGEDMVLDIKGGKFEDTDFKMESYNNGNGKWKLTNKDGHTEQVDAIIEDGILRKNRGELNAKPEELFNGLDGVVYQSGYHNDEKQKIPADIKLLGGLQHYKEGGPLYEFDASGKKLVLSETPVSGGDSNAVVVRQVIKEEKHDTKFIEAQKQELTLRSSAPVEGEQSNDYLKDLRDIHEKAGKYVDWMSENEGVFGSVPVDIKIPPHLLHNIGDQLTYKNKEDLVREIALYNIKSLPPKPPVDLTINEDVNSVEPAVVKPESFAGKELGGNSSTDDNASKVEKESVAKDKVNEVSTISGNEGIKDIKTVARDLEQKNAEITKKVEDMGMLPLLKTGKRKEIDKLNQEKEKETRDAYKVIGEKRGMTKEAIALDAKIREKQNQVLALQLGIQDRKDIKENSGWIWKGIDWAGENIGVITPLADKERELKDLEKGVINLQKDLLALKNGGKPEADKLKQDSIIKTVRQKEKLFTEYANGKKTLYNEKEGELITKYPNGKLIVGNRDGDFKVKLPDNTFISNKGIKLPNGRERDSEGILITPSMDWKDSFEKGANAVKATGTFVWSLMKWPVTREYPNFGKYGKSSE